MEQVARPVAAPRRNPEVPEEALARDVPLRVLAKLRLDRLNRGLGMQRRVRRAVADASTGYLAEGAAGARRRPGGARRTILSLMRGAMSAVFIELLDRDAGATIGQAG